MLFTSQVMSISSQLHGLLQARPSCPSSSPGVCPSSYPFHQWFHSTISSLCCPLLHSVFPSMKVFSNELAIHIRWPKYWCFSSSPSNKYSVLISFKIDCFDLFVVQGTLKSLLQHHSSKVSILWCSAFFIVQPSQPHVTIGKTCSLNYRDLCWQSDTFAF